MLNLTLTTFVLIECSNASILYIHQSVLLCIIIFLIVLFFVFFNLYVTIYLAVAIL